MTKQLKITDFVVKDNFVSFDSYRAGVFYYNVCKANSDITYQFQVPLEDVSGVTLMADDKAVLFMRWIRKSIENNTMIKI